MLKRSINKDIPFEEERIGRTYPIVNNQLLNIAEGDTDLTVLITEELEASVRPLIERRNRRLTV